MKHQPISTLITKNHEPPSTHQLSHEPSANHHRTASDLPPLETHRSYRLLRPRVRRRAHQLAEGRAQILGAAHPTRPPGATRDGDRAMVADGEMSDEQKLCLSTSEVSGVKC